MNNVKLALNICTYNREKNIASIIGKLQHSLFFDTENANSYQGKLYIYVVDNAGTLKQCDTDRIFIKHNPKGNVGGSGGYQYGIELIRASGIDFTNVIFMDDDVEFELSCFYKLYDFLTLVDHENADRPVAGRMFRMDDRSIQYTAAEIWNEGHIKHVGFNKTISQIETEPDIDYNSTAEYSGWWFCCFPFAFVKDNDVMPFFIHCDDVEYGLRCGKSPVIIKDVQVWHETYEFHMTPIICYYDTRNPLFVNEKYGLIENPQKVLNEWKEKLLSLHLEQKWDYEYYTIQAMLDYLKGFNWLYRIDPGKYHKRLQRVFFNRYKNSLLWRVAERRFKYKYGLK